MSPLGIGADPDKPFYQEQFRVIMPEIPAEVRDPLVMPMPVACDFNLSSGSVVYHF